MPARGERLGPCIQCGRTLEEIPPGELREAGARCRAGGGVEFICSTQCTDAIQVREALGQTFEVGDVGATLEFQVDGGPARTVSFNRDVSAFEVAQEIANNVPGVTARVDERGHVVLRSEPIESSEKDP